jgi:hypothetical protein
MGRLAPRIIHHKNGMASLVGIPYEDLISILASASIHHYDTERDFRDRMPEMLAKIKANENGIGNVIRKNLQDSAMWVKRIRVILNMLDHKTKFWKDSWESKRVADLTTWEKSGRIENVKDNRRFRRYLDSRSYLDSALSC